MKLRLKTPLSWQRLAAGAALATLGLLFLAAERPIAGGTLVLLGTAVGVRGLTAVIIVFIYAFLVASIVIGASFLADTLNDTRTFAEWTQDSLVTYLVVGIAALSILINGLTFESRAWRALELDFGEVEGQLPEGDVPVASGVMRIHEDVFLVSIFPTNDGIVITRTSGECIFFSWDRISLIKPDGIEGQSATINVTRKSPLPLEIKVPWSSRISTYVPRKVSVAGV